VLRAYSQTTDSDISQDKTRCYKGACQGRNHVKLHRLHTASYAYTFGCKVRGEGGFEDLVSDLLPVPSEVVLNVPAGGGPDNILVPFEIEYTFDKPIEIAGFEIWQCPVGIPVST
jgi:hypothetical protein